MDEEADSGIARERHRALDDVRRRNLSDVLRLVHRSGRATRAELTRATGLNRSTVAAIVGELVRRGLVVEQAAVERSGVGRPSFVVEPSPATFAIAVNPEVDAVTIAFVGLGGRILREFRFAQHARPTPDSVAELVGGVLDGIRPERDTGAFRVLGVGAAVPGLVRTDEGVVQLAPGLDWHEAQLGRALAEHTGLPAFAANDANCGALALRRPEADAGDFIYLNGGASGIGGGIVVGGRLLGGASGFAGELGHVLVDPDGPLCQCGSTGCLQSIVEQAALLDCVGLGPGEAHSLEARLVEAVATDAPGAAVVERQLAALGAALRDVVNLANPEQIVLGGFLGMLLAATGDRLVESVRRTALPGPAADLTIVRSDLGARDLLAGAAELVIERVLADPTLVPEPGTAAA